MRCSLCGLLLLAALSTTLHACKDRRSTPGPAKQVIMVEKDDPRLIKASEEARRRFSEFAEAFVKRKPTDKFMIKSGFKVRGGGEEHMWINVTAFNGSNIKGTL